MRSLASEAHLQAGNRSEWDDLGDRSTPNWYLDRLVADQKRAQHQRLIRRWTADTKPQSLLKTDVFEEAHGGDQILFDLLQGVPTTIGMDVALPTVAKAQQRCTSPRISFYVGDARGLPLRDSSIDLVLSTSTLDHFETRDEFRRSLAEIARIIRPGGELIITLDNAYNPWYYPLRWVSQRRSAPFPLGYTASLRELRARLTELGLEIIDTETLIHNPRLVSSALFTALRFVLGRFADLPIKALLWFFALGDYLPTRWISGCFIAVRTRKLQHKSLPH